MSDQSPDAPQQPVPYLRLGITGVFMGLANLVPGVSGGTMVVALGLYQEFIDAMARVTRLRFTARAITVLAMLFGIAMVMVFVFASLIEQAMMNFLPGMLALFIGMTLGGGPTLWKELRSPGAGKFVAIAAGFVVMATIALLLKPGAVEPNWILFFIGGIIGSSAMILPGISGSYLLLVIGLYLPIISGISDFRHALSTRDMEMAVNIVLTIVMPVGLGLVVGIVALSNLLKFLLDRYHQPTTGVLLGLLVGSVLGLYPFRAPDFDKLPRYAVEQEGSRELRVMGFGWDATAGDAIYDRLRNLQGEGLSIVILSASVDATPSANHVNAAREWGAVIVAYDVPVDRETRRASREKKQSSAAGGRAVRVELTQVPDTRFTTARGALCFFLGVIGFGITLGLGRMGSSRGAAAKT